MEHPPLTQKSKLLIMCDANDWDDGAEGIRKSRVVLGLRRHGSGCAHTQAHTKLVTVEHDLG